MKYTARQKAAQIRSAAHEEIFSLCESASSESAQLHVIARTGERHTRPKSKLIIAIKSPERAALLCERINAVVSRTQQELRALKITDKFEYNVKIAHAQSADILLTISEAYKQLKYTGEELLSRCTAIMEQLALQRPESSKKILTECEFFKTYYEEALSRDIESSKHYYIIQNTGNKYRLSYYGAEEESKAPHRIQSSVGDIFILSGIDRLDIRSSKQKTRADKTSEADYIYSCEYFRVKPM